MTFPFCIRDAAAILRAVAPRFIESCRAKPVDRILIPGNFKCSQLKAARLACLHLDAALQDLQRNVPGLSRTPEWRVVEKLRQATLVSLFSPIDRTPELRRFMQRALRNAGTRAR